MRDDSHPCCVNHCILAVSAIIAKNRPAKGDPLEENRYRRETFYDRGRTFGGGGTKTFLVTQKILTRWQLKEAQQCRRSWGNIRNP